MNVEPRAGSNVSPLPPPTWPTRKRPPRLTLPATVDAPVGAALPPPPPPHAARTLAALSPTPAAPPRRRSSRRVHECPSSAIGSRAGCSFRGRNVGRVSLSPRIDHTPRQDATGCPLC